MIPPLRTVHCTDGLHWLATNPLPQDHAVLTSLPDTSELRRLSFPQWCEWFRAASEAVLRATPSRSAAVFYQTDVKRNGHWVDKAFLVQQAAANAGVPLIWHKIVCRAPPGIATGNRPGYAHLLGFSRELGDTPQPATPDVLPQLGAMSWPRAMGQAAVVFAVTWLRECAGARTVVDPFCGVGTALAVANQQGLDAVGVEIAPSRAARARVLQVR